ncbi:MAG: sulfotransferase [Pirellulales bacterium]|nr:sulfotransferase [Pirellulales bacterium]
MARPNHVFIAGVQKGGTSTLYHRLICHPQIISGIRPDDQKAIKEMDFFDNQWQRGLAWYRSHFQDSTRIGLDATPNYICAIDAHARLRRHYPDAKLIVSLRNPVERAFSQYNHYMQEMPESLSWDWRRPGDLFDENIEAELNASRRNWYGMVRRGFYIEQLEHLLRYFPRDQIHVIVMERWSRDPDPMLRRVMDFLELDRCSLPPCISHMRAYDVELDQAVQDRLINLYRPYNERLFEWLGEEITEWESIG